jgi:DNA-directed RNA polymerase subunit RPC12/RpoP
MPPPSGHLHARCSKCGNVFVVDEPQLEMALTTLGPADPQATWLAINDAHATCPACGTRLLLEPPH